MEKIYLRDWKWEGDRVKLIYRDGSVLYAGYEDFNRAFQCFVSCPKDEILRDFAIA